jgi:hypothetical protein
MMSWSLGWHVHIKLGIRILNLIKAQIFWDVMLCSWFSVSQPFEETVPTSTSVEGQEECTEYV